MPLDLFRIDERLLHGQVIVGWGERLGIEYYLVVDDDLAASEWEQELYESGMSDSTTVVFASVEETVRQFAALDARKGRGALLTRDTAVMRDLADRGLLADRSVNVGAIHMGDGADDQAGHRVANAGDVNNDGRPDYMIGAYTDASGGQDAGAVFLMLAGAGE